MKSLFLKLSAVLFCVWQLSGCGESQASQRYDLGRIYLSNPSATIPPQCYTQTRNEDGTTSNPCYVCHTASKRPNFTNDLDLQLSYDFAAPATLNRWSNLFIDRRDAIADMDDQAVLDYVRQNNYEENGRVPLVDKLTGALPDNWDDNHNGHWDGYVPDVGYHFDDQGFDHDVQGRLTGWRALAYTPFPGTFFPTNGSADDVLIRLPAAWREDESGQPDQTVYRVNLAIVEALIKEKDIAIAPVNERRLNVDLDKDGQLGEASRIAYDWAPLEGRLMHYVGRARLLQASGKAKLAARSYPLGTEFVHTVRYLDIAPDGEVVMAPRMKELRYARKTRWMTYYQQRALAETEIKEAHDFPDRLEPVIGDIEKGMSNRHGWRYSGFIEGRDGELRPQSYEELATCAGCHGAVGAVADSSFSMERKLDGTAFQRGWYHWSQKSLAGQPEPLREDGQGEYAFYLKQVGNADEYRSNREVRARFFDADGNLKPAMLAQLKNDISVLVMPSGRRALELNKAYRLVVQEQSYSRGRDVALAPKQHLLERVEAGERTGITEPQTYR
ncbi:hypothetical protein A11A3_00505 [Alcanivorax hongdengensis A-11-3]|uniref:Uncharacterized protein n=1 Tax=Alcanivorax hongdengensis A-11-3 TaxID=1177179 RepID=L0WGV9_9GAMM|nr:hypothetical protein [Alcanivorax hongdengensis]EKF75929.1 hypothetical protein A11A3_00505 [Alcanivorax hongdengensis A-11-3]